MAAVPRPQGSELPRRRQTAMPRTRLPSAFLTSNPGRSGKHQNDARTTLTRIGLEHCMSTGKNRSSSEKRDETRRTGRHRAAMVPLHWLIQLVNLVSVRQNITIQLCPIFSRSSAREPHPASVCIRVHPWPNRLFCWRLGQLSKLVFWATMTRIHHDRCLGFTEKRLLAKLVATPNISPLSRSPSTILITLIPNPGFEYTAMCPSFHDRSSSR